MDVVIKSTIRSSFSFVGLYSMSVMTKKVREKKTKGQTKDVRS